MQWFHIGSYRLAEPFSQQGGRPTFSKWLCDRVLKQSPTIEQVSSVPF